MATRVVRRRKLQKYSVGDMRERISVKARALTAPSYSDADFTEAYTTVADDWADVETLDGAHRFSGVNIVEGATHFFVVRYDAVFTAENIIEWEGEYYKVLRLTNLDGRFQYHLFQARLLGSSDYEANQ